VPGRYTVLSPSSVRYVLCDVCVISNLLRVRFSTWTRGPTGISSSLVALGDAYVRNDSGGLRTVPKRVVLDDLCNTHIDRYHDARGFRLSSKCTRITSIVACALKFSSGEIPLSFWSSAIGDKKKKKNNTSFSVIVSSIRTPNTSYCPFIVFSSEEIMSEPVVRTRTRAYTLARERSARRYTESP